MRKLLVLGAAAALVALTTIGGFVVDARAQEKLASADLADMSLEELMDIEVYSVGKKAQKLSDSAAAAYVLTQEDIRRSGVTNVADALRLVPGVEVAHIDSNKWAITIRGFNDRFANKLLVLIDGRSVYTPLFAGVYWDIQDLVLEDIDRIEVIRGPGGTLWGANAVNGVINIITKSAKDTQGVLLSGGAGNEEQGFATARYGTKFAENGYVRVFGKYFQRDSYRATAAPLDYGQGSDSWHLAHTGFRGDWDPTAKDSLTFQGDFYDGRADSFTTIPILTINPPPDLPYTESGTDRSDLIGGNMLGRWTHRLEGGSETQLQAYYDRTGRDSTPVNIDEQRNTADIDFQHRFQFATRHDVVWGLGYRVTWDDIDNVFQIQFKPRQRTLNLVSGFVQDEISFLDDSVHLTLGTKLESNDYAGFEAQPNIRALWKATERQRVWAAISGAVRTPSRAEEDIRINSQVVPLAGPPFGPCSTNPLAPSCAVVSMFGGSWFDSENLVAFELGYRAEVQENLAFDVVGFYDLYTDLRTITPAFSFVGGVPVPQPDSSVPYLMFPYDVGNDLDADTWGFEVAADWRPLDFWKIRSGYTFLEMDLDFQHGVHPNPAGVPMCPNCDPISGSADGASPQNQIFVRSLVDLPYHLELDTNFKWVDELKSLDINAYAQLDLRLGWHPTEALELSLVGQNLLYDARQQFAASAFVSDEPTEVQRGVYGKVTVKF